MENLRICRSTLDSADGVRLIAALNAELTVIFPEPGATHFSLSGAQVVEGDGAFVVAYLDGVAVGCGAVRRLDETTAEIKRMYVDPSVRGRGIGRTLVGALSARNPNWRNEDCTQTQPASRLRSNSTRRWGYAPIPLFGEYLASPGMCLCFGKPPSDIDVDESNG